MPDILGVKLAELERVAALGGEKLPRLRNYVERMDAQGMKLSWADLHEFAVRFASERDEDFFNYILQHYKDVRAGAAARYVPPSAMVVSTERAEACVAAVLGIGIGWVWAWLAVSPWTAERRSMATPTG